MTSILKILTSVEKTLASVLRSVRSIVIPEYCCVCGKRLCSSEHNVCALCLLSLPYTRFDGKKGNPAERVFWGKFPIKKASAYLFYQQGADSRLLIWDLKYYNRPNVGYIMGKAMARELLPTGFFADISILIPVPLAKKKEKERGYNQSAFIAEGVAIVTGITVERKAVKRVKTTKSQTHLSHFERQENVDGIFSVVKPERLAGKEVLIIDDVLTTGATIASLATEIIKARAASVSVLSLAASVHIGRL